MKEQNKDLNEDGAVDMTGIRPVDALAADPLEREEREALKKLAKAAPTGEYVCLTNIKGDNNKLFKRGDVYDGILYPDLLQAKAVCKKSEWVSR